MSFDKDAPKPVYVKIGSLWRSKQGKASLTGSLGTGGARISIFPVNPDYKKENGPDYEICLSPAAPKKDYSQSTAPQSKPQAKKEEDELEF